MSHGFKLIYLSLLIFLVSAGCASEPKPNGVINYDGKSAEFDWATFDANKKLWTKTNSSNYRMILEDMQRTGTLITIEVKNGQAVSAKRSDNPYQSVLQQYSSYDTIQKIFEVVEAEAKKKQTVFVRFGTEGYPQYVELTDPAGTDKKLTISVAAVVFKD